jgi:hypothetical protein
MQSSCAELRRQAHSGGSIKAARDPQTGARSCRVRSECGGDAGQVRMAQASPSLKVLGDLGIGRVRPWRCAGLARRLLRRSSTSSMPASWPVTSRWLGAWLSGRSGSGSPCTLPDEPAWLPGPRTR